MKALKLHGRPRGAGRVAGERSRGASWPVFVSGLRARRRRDGVALSRGAAACRRLHGGRPARVAAHDGAAVGFAVVEAAGPLEGGCAASAADGPAFFPPRPARPRPVIAHEHLPGDGMDQRLDGRPFSSSGRKRISGALISNCWRIPPLAAASVAVTTRLLLDGDRRHLLIFEQFHLPAAAGRVCGGAHRPWRMRAGAVVGASRSCGDQVRMCSPVATFSPAVRSGICATTLPRTSIRSAGPSRSARSVQGDIHRTGAAALLVVLARFLSIDGGHPPSARCAVAGANGRCA